MVEHNPPPADARGVPVIPRPVALYVSDELCFELYDGGQPCRRFLIRWERLAPAKKSEPEAAPRTPQRACARPRTNARVPDPPNADVHPISNG
jgi:hypothetical protein